MGILLAHARHRLRRVPLAGVDRPTFDRLRQAAAGLDRRGGGVMGAEIGGLRLEDFYAYQAAFIPARRRRRGGRRLTEREEDRPRDGLM